MVENKNNKNNLAAKISRNFIKKQLVTYLIQHVNNDTKKIQNRTAIGI